MTISVMKFGGTSVGSTDKIKHVADKVKKKAAAGEKVVVVVSAMGKTTDHLVELADNVTSRPNKREMDMLLATGEQQTIALLAMCLKDRDIPAISLTGWQAGITTEALHGNARIEDIDGSIVNDYLDEGNVVIVAGFQGVTADKQITTLGRGGSDTSAVAVAAALRADRCEIYTDVDGVYTTDPRYVKEAKKIDSIQFDEMLELAHLGAGVLHPRAVENAKKYGIPLVVRSTFSEEDGTIIKEEAPLEKELVVRGLAFEKEVTRITLTGLKNNMEALSNVFTCLADHHVDVDIIIQNGVEGDTMELSFTVHDDQLEEAIAALRENETLLGFNNIQTESELAKVSIVGAGMVSNPGVAAKMFKSLSSEGIAVKMITTSEIKISTVLPVDQLTKSLNILHEVFELGKISVPVTN